MNRFAGVRASQGPGRFRRWWGAGLAAATAAVWIGVAGMHQRQRNDRLVWAVHRDNAAEVSDLLRSGARANAKYRFAFDLSRGNRYKPTGESRVVHWRPLLVLAAWRGRPAIVEALLAHGADPNAADEAGRSALMYALIYEHAEVVKLLLDSGAAVNAADIAGNTAVTYAAMEDNTDALRQLGARGAELDARVESGQTPLMLAAREGKSAAVRTLIDLGANVALSDGYGRTAGELAHQKGHSDIAAVLKRAEARRRVPVSTDPAS